jgi:uncharacterized OsmC-like protein
MRYLVLVLALAGCGHYDANIYGGLMGQNIIGNEASVQVTNVWNQADAFPLAERHCRKFSRAARLNNFNANIANFDCVKA